MKKWITFGLALLFLGLGLWIAGRAARQQTLVYYEDQPTAVATTQLPETQQETTAAPETVPPTLAPTLPPTETTTPDVLTFTPEEEELLLKLAMAERGDTGCTTCMALVIRTVLNRVESPKFSSTIRGVIYAEDQFTPVMDGSFEKAEPDWLCEEALDQVRKGWDESRGALYYEWCEGESWHSQNLTLLTQHCDTRFYN